MPGKRLYLLVGPILAICFDRLMDFKAAFECHCPSWIEVRTPKIFAVRFFFLLGGRDGVTHLSSLLLAKCQILCGLRASRRFSSSHLERALQIQILEAACLPGFDSHDP